MFGRVGGVARGFVELRGWLVGVVLGLTCVCGVCDWFHLLVWCVSLLRGLRPSVWVWYC